MVSKEKETNAETKSSPFTEVGRVRTSDTTFVVVSKTDTGFSINKYIESIKFTGFTKGIFVPDDCLARFLAIFSEDDLRFALENKEQLLKGEM